MRMITPIRWFSSQSASASPLPGAAMPR
ncbi:hypothetical protein IEO21_10389 [Rhodonia placenta]|uniref:Uncharacterized protein n=1 Tax=Rhodonia placenta TaxID=104341 RepID=A0A8H7TXC5_9APHY|nr:hypothetical protein IEO21_10389 [Postia placenta]